MSSYDRAHSLGYKYRCINHLSFARYLITIVPSTVIAALCNSSFPLQICSRCREIRFQRRGWGAAEAGVESGTGKALLSGRSSKPWTGHSSTECRIIHENAGNCGFMRVQFAHRTRSK